MLNRATRIGKRVLYAIVSNAIYGVAIYFLHTWLVGFSLLHAYLGNLALIVLALILDEQTLRYLQSEKLAMQVRKDGDIETNYRFIQRWFQEYFVSFKAILYVFYIAILIVSQIVDFHPGLLGEDLGSFVLTIRYSIVLLIAFDKLIGQLASDRARTKEILAQIRGNLFGDQG